MLLRRVSFDDLSVCTHFCPIQWYVSMLSRRVSFVDLECVYTLLPSVSTLSASTHQCVCTENMRTLQPLHDSVSQLMPSCYERTGLSASDSLLWWQVFFTCGPVPWLAPLSSPGRTDHILDTPCVVEWGLSILPYHLRLTRLCYYLISYWWWGGAAPCKARRPPPPSPITTSSGRSRGHEGRHIEGDISGADPGRDVVGIHAIFVLGNPGDFIAGFPVSRARIPVLRL